MVSITAISSAPCLGALKTPPAVCMMQWIKVRTEAMRRKGAGFTRASRVYGIILPGDGPPAFRIASSKRRHAFGREPKALPKLCYCLIQKNFGSPG